MDDAVVEVDAADAELAVDRERSLARRLAPTDLRWSEGGEALACESVRTHAEAALGAMIEVGRWLHYAKGELDHGEFRRWLSEQGISRDMAQRAMGIAARIADRSFARTLGSRSKAVALLGLSDDQLDQLDDEGRVGEIDVDELDRLNYRELQAKVRELNSKAEKGKAQLEKARAKGAKLEEQLDELREGRVEVDPENEAHARATFAFARAYQALKEFGAAIEGLGPADATWSWSQLSKQIAEIRESQPSLIGVEAAGATEGGA